MKWIKTFEELNSYIYKRAAKKLAKMGHSKRSKELEEWGNTMEFRNSRARWVKNIEEYSKFGDFKIKITDKNGKELIIDDFYLSIVFEHDMFIDCMPENDSICFFIGIIPKNEETIKKCNSVLPEPDFGNGFYWGMNIAIKFEIVKDTVNITNFFIYNYDTSVSGNVELADRRSAVKFKNLIKNILNDPNFNYPSTRNGMYMYQDLESTICVEGEFSSNYGFSIDDLGKFVDKISPNQLFKN